MLFLSSQVFIFDGLYDVLSADETVGVSGCVSAQAGFPSPHPKRRHIKARRTASTAGGTKLAPQRAGMPFIARQRSRAAAALR